MSEEDISRQIVALGQGWHPEMLPGWDGYLRDNCPSGLLAEQSTQRARAGRRVQAVGVRHCQAAAVLALPAQPGLLSWQMSALAHGLCQNS